MGEETQPGTETTSGSVPPPKSASSILEAEENPHVRSILAIAQRLHIDFLPISWGPALDTVGEAPTAEVLQSMLNRLTGFAFQHYERPSGMQSDADESKRFQRVCSEISVLGQPNIREHPNIIRLEGLCWDSSPDGKEDWPVLVFKKASFGSLTQWSASSEGKAAARHVRLKLCADVANAIRHLHAHDIIHGGIEPDSVLVFRDESNKFIAKVAGFGSSTISTSQSIIHVPNSGHWTAPEWHHEGFEASIAMKMDVYSLGVLTLWLVFYENQDHGGQSFPEYLASKIRSPLDLNRMISEKSETNDKEKRDLMEFFNATLALDPNGRTSDLTECVSLLTQKPVTAPIFSDSIAKGQLDPAELGVSES